jgi:CheY-like chemotaxis protein
MADLLSDSELSPEQRGYVDIFRNAGDNLIKIINDILDVSKVEEGRLELERVPFDLKEMLEGRAAVFTAPARKKGLELKVDFDDAVPLWVEGDPGRMGQVISNLLGNAFKFTETGGVTLAVKPADPDARGGGPVAEGETRLHFCVRDTGVGIPKEKLETVFERFGQADSSTTRKFGGSGLGLTIAQRIVELMDGEIWVESVEGEGSTFQFTGRFPIASPAGEAKKEAPAEAEEEIPLRVLLVDDTAQNRMLVKAYLKKTPHSVDEAENGEIAVEMATSGDPYDIILMDMQMPVMDGYTAARTLREYEEEKGMPRNFIVALSAHALQEEVQKSLDAGCDRYLTKPIKKKPFLAAMKEYARESGKGT